MAHDSEHDRIARKAHELWESEGRPHGRDQVHWDEAKEIVALQDSMDETLLPRETGATEPEEPALAVTNQGEMPNLADQGPDDLTSTDREPAVTKAKPKAAPAAKAEAPKPAAAAPKPAAAPARPEPSPAKTPAPKPAEPSPVGNATPVSVTGKAAPKAAAKPAPVTRGKPGRG